MKITVCIIPNIRSSQIRKTVIVESLKNGQNQQLNVKRQNIINYDELTDEEIQSETQLLFEGIKVLNQYINDMMIEKRRYFKVRYQSQQHLETKLKEKQTTVNGKLLNNLKVQYKSLSSKNKEYDDPEKKFLIEKQIQQDKSTISKLKLQVNQLKRRSILTEKKLKSHKKNDLEPYQEMKEKYIEYLKKRQNMEHKLEKVEEQNININYELSEVQTKFTKVRNKLSHYHPDIRRENQQEHLETVYTAKKKCLSLVIRKLQRQDENKKRNYYQLLKDLEEKINSISQISDKLSKTQEQNLNVIDQINILQQKMQNYSDEEQNGTGTGFMLTQLSEEKRKKTKIHKFSHGAFQSKKRSQTDFNISNNQTQISRIWAMPSQPIQYSYNVEKQKMNKQDYIQEKYPQDFQC